MTEEFERTFESMKNWLWNCPASSWKVDYKFQNGQLKRITLTLDVVRKDDDEIEDENQQQLPLDEN